MSAQRLWLFSLILIPVFILSLEFTSCSGDINSTPVIDSAAIDLDWNKQIAVAYVHSYAVAISKAVPEMKDDSAKINFIRRAIDPISFYPDSSGYFYVYDFNCMNIAHARQKSLHGQNLYDHKDTHGKYVIRELSAMAKKGGGFVEFYWIKPGDQGEKRKLGYVEPIENTDYFIGAGVYLE